MSRPSPAHSSAPISSILTRSSRAPSGWPVSSEPGLSTASSSRTLLLPIWHDARRAGWIIGHCASQVVSNSVDSLTGDREMLWGRRRGDGTIVAVANRWSAPMPQPNDLSRSLVALDQDSTIIAVVEMSQSSWLVAGMLPGIERQPRKKLEPSPERLLGLLHPSLAH